MDYSSPVFSVHGISQQEYWSGLPFPTLQVLPNRGIEPVSPSLAGRLVATEPLGMLIIASQLVHWKTIRLPMKETQVQSLGGEDPLEEGMATHSSILA